MDLILRNVKKKDFPVLKSLKKMKNHMIQNL